MQRVPFILMLSLCACGSSGGTSSSTPSSPDAGAGTSSAQGSWNGPADGEDASAGDGAAGDPGPVGRVDAGGTEGGPPVSGPITVYDDGKLTPPWFDASWTTRVLDSTLVPYEGKDTISVTFGAWTALCFDNETGIAQDGGNSLSFEIYGGTNTAPDLTAMIYFDNKVWGPTIPITPYCDGGAIASNVWTHCSLPLSVLGEQAQTITEIAIQESGGEDLAPMAFSTLQVVAGVPDAGANDAGTNDASDSGTDASDEDAGAPAADAGTDAAADAGGAHLG